MIQIKPTDQINVEQLRSLLLKRKIIRPRFKIPLTYEQTKDALLAAFQAEVEYRHQEFRESPEILSYIDQASHWLTDQKKMGLLMCGVPGNGKTTLMRAISNLINLFELKDDYSQALFVRTLDAREIVRLSRDAFDQYRKTSQMPMLAIDDLGLEPAEVLDYGNVLNPVIDLLSTRYNDQLFTLVTTNLTGKQIREKYGDRIADRFNEMMDVIIFKTSSYRGKK